MNKLDPAVVERWERAEVAYAQHVAETFAPGDVCMLHRDGGKLALFGNDYVVVIERIDKGCVWALALCNQRSVHGHWVNARWLTKITDPSLIPDWARREAERVSGDG